MRSLLALAFLLTTAPMWSAEPEPLVPKVRAAVQPDVDQHRPDAQKATLEMLAAADSIPALFKPPLRQRAVKDPWGALTELEQRGLDLAAVARGGLKNLPALVNALGHFLDKPAAKPVAVERGKLETLDDYVRHIVAVLDAADALREQALANVSAKDREFLFARPAALIHEFGPQEMLDDTTRPHLEGDRKFCKLIEESVDGPKFASAVQTFLQLTDPAFLDGLRAALAKAAPLTTAAPEGMSGDLLLVRETRHGLIVFGGAGKNVYTLTRPVAFLADLGGDDTYRGTVAASFDAKHPFSLVVDFAGNDTYEPAELGLATGRLGCGCLIDRGGDDVYKLAPGCGGCGFGGVGLLIDEAGKDTYTGSHYTQGAAVAGLGLLFDVSGDDTYTSFGYAIGLGGPAGVGAVIDVAGDDRYQCGHKDPSGYNASDAPNAKPGDPNFQYDAFGMGIGLGRRTWPPTPESVGYQLAGGVGVWLDLAGNDRSESSNFAQACAYFFGIGLKLDLAGNDQHGAARYGHAAGAHFGMGLFLDYEGDDTYTSVGPTYNLGCAWDRSVFLFADGAGNDTYDLTKSSGCGRADHGGWAVFADLAGTDRYRVNGPLGVVTDRSLATFFDGGGEDEYPKLTAPAAPANGKTHRDGGGTFIDR